MSSIELLSDGDQWHHNPKKADSDNLRNNDFSSVGWHTIRFSSNQIFEQLQSYCVPLIKNQINNFGGLKGDDFFTKRFPDLNKDFQLDAFDL